jgi:RecB family exonuclease
VIDLTTVATPARPLRASSIPKFMRCPLNVILSYEADDQPGVAADTGSAVHYAAAVFHKNAKSLRDALKAMRGQASLYPFADLDVAEEHFRGYAEDPRQAAGEVVLCEHKVQVVLDPADEDPTRQPVVINGTLDQIRRKDGVLRLWDIKTGAADGPTMLTDYAYQLAAYQVGATALLGEPVLSAGVIRTKGYLKKRGNPDPIFWEAAWTLEGARRMLRHVVREVANVRAGRVRLTPGPQCHWCPAQGIGSCVSL